MASTKAQRKENKRAGRQVGRALSLQDPLIMHVVLWLSKFHNGLVSENTFFSRMKELQQRVKRRRATLEKQLAAGIVKSVDNRRAVANEARKMSRNLMMINGALENATRSMINRSPKANEYHKRLDNAPLRAAQQRMMRMMRVQRREN